LFWLCHSPCKNTSNIKAANAPKRCILLQIRAHKPACCHDWTLVSHWQIWQSFSTGSPHYPQLPGQGTWHSFNLCRVGKQSLGTRSIRYYYSRKVAPGRSLKPFKREV
jgi:hypothetical protein